MKADIVKSGDKYAIKVKVNLFQTRYIRELSVSNMNDFSKEPYWYESFDHAQKRLVKFLETKESIRKLQLELKQKEKFETVRTFHI
ncbi:MAG: hypothetical protein RL621_49 [Bacteroidota bacterium]|jgi:hypothetical protein